MQPWSAKSRLLRPSGLVALDRPRKTDASHIFMRRCLRSIATLTGTAPGLGDGKEGPIRPTAEIALDLFVLLRLQVTLKGLCGDMFVRCNQRCGALCGASAASVNAPFFFSELRRPCASSCRLGFYAPESFVAQSSSGWQFNVSRPHSVLMLSVKPLPMCCGCPNRNRTPGSCFTASARRTDARSRFSSPDRG